MAYNELQVQCTERRIFRNLYGAQGQPRTAQVSLCRGPDDVAVDIINVHAPSGNWTLTDAQRKTLLRNLLQSNSKSMPGHTVGTARFLIGGDMNMSSHLLSQMLQVLRQDGVLQTIELVMEPTMPKHGDVCFLGGFVAQNLETTAKNHDPQHVPYGIQWISSLASGYATEQFPISSFGSPRHRAELHTTAEELQQAAEPQTAQKTTSSTEELTKPASGSATEQTLPEEKRQPLPADKMLAYSIVNEFLGKKTFNNPEAEHMLLAALEDESPWIAQKQHRIAEVFEPIFFHYPHGLQDRSVWEPRDTGKYISKWRQLAALREHIEPRANAQSMHFSKEQVAQIFALHFADFKTTLRPDQLDKKWAYHKSCFESKLRTEAGSRFVVNAIWEVGVPRMPSFATEQQCRQLSVEELEAVPDAIHNVLHWLDSLATTLIQHHETAEYQEAKRKSGDTHGKTGLSATEYETRAAIRKAKLDMRTATRLAAQWENKELTYQSCQNWQFRLLSVYWDGSLQQRLDELTAGSNADPMCRTPAVQNACYRAYSTVP